MAEREAFFFAENCAEPQPASRVERAATADERDYIRKWLGYSRNVAILLGLEVRYNLYEGMPVESNRHATFRTHFNIINSKLGFPMIHFCPHKFFVLIFEAVLQVNYDYDDYNDNNNNNNNNRKIGYLFEAFA